MCCRCTGVNCCSLESLYDMRVGVWYCPADTLYGLARCAHRMHGRRVAACSSLPWYGYGPPLADVLPQPTRVAVHGSGVA